MRSHSGLLILIAAAGKLVPRLVRQVQGHFPRILHCSRSTDSEGEDLTPRLGVPKFYRKNPKSTPDLPGVKHLDTDILGPYTAAHAQSFPKNVEGVKPYGSIILYSHASIEDPNPIYHGRGKCSNYKRGWRLTLSQQQKCRVNYVYA